MNRVLVLSSSKIPLMPCHPARARELLRKNKAAVYRVRPFTIILHARTSGAVQQVEFKVDPGSKTTGLALVALFKRGRDLLWGANLEHRGQVIRKALETRRSLRHGRRYRQARFLNRTRRNKWLSPYATSNALQSVGLPTNLWTGGRTKYNRVAQGYPKEHYIDAACVGITGEKVRIKPGYIPIIIKAMGRGKRQVVTTDKYGFPRSAPKSKKSVLGFRTGDLVKIVQTKGKFIGNYLARISAIKIANNYLSIHINNKQTWFAAKLATLMQRGDGYAYA